MKIINMDKFRADDDDRQLFALFASDHVADNGFSEAVMRRVQRKTRRRQWLITLAWLAGGLLAAGPVLQLARELGIFLANLFAGPAHPGVLLPVLQTAYATPLFTALLISLLAVVRLLED